MSAPAAHHRIGPRLGAAFACLLALAPTPGARAQGIDTVTIAPPPARGARGVQPPASLIVPRIAAATEAPERPVMHQRPARPLTRDEETRLADVRRRRLAGELRQAQAALAPLLATAEHHPAVITERIRLLLARQDFAGVQRLARSERAAQRDSLLATRELVLALEQLGRPAEAIGVVIESWAASPLVTDWAQGTLLRLAPADPPGTRMLLRRALRARPDRNDLVRVRALLDCRAGDVRAALEGLERAERPGERRGSLRWDLARELIEFETAPDSAAATEVLGALAADGRLEAARRLMAGERAWELHGARGTRDEAAPALARALRDVPATSWPEGFMVALARTLRQSGRTDEARALLRGSAAPPGTLPQLDLEGALADLRDGPPEHVLPRLARLAETSPEAAWYLAEALFFAGRSDSALACYGRMAADPQSPFSGAALERSYLIEDAEPRVALAVLGRIAYDDWRGDRHAAMARTDSLVCALPRGPLWAQAALLLAGQRAAAGDARGALVPLLAVADSLPGDRLAPLARQRAGDLYLHPLRDERAALAQYEECLARYPRAWNAPEVRRVVERLRRTGPS